MEGEASHVANAKANASLGFVSERIGDIGYLAFSGGIQMITQESEYYSTCRNLVSLDSAGAGLFSALKKSNNFKGDEDEAEVMMLALINESKSIVITGHSIGGTTASLCALWLLSYMQSNSSTHSVFCITFGSPLLGNEALSRAILRERWGGNFCHVVSKYDIMPRLLFAPLESCTRQLHFLLQYWQMSMTSSPSNFGHLPVLQLGEEEKAKLFSFISYYNLQVSSMAQAEAGEEKPNSLYWTFGNYLFCTQEGAICVDNAASVIKMMHLMFTTGNPSCCIDDHLKYGDYVGKISSQFLNKKSFSQGELLPESSYEAGVALALQSTGISSQESAARPVEDCLKITRRMGNTRTPSLNAANLAITLSRLYLTELNWSVLHMLENNELPHDFQERSKWVNGSHSYKLLVEPLDIAEYYRSGMHRNKGHYLKHGREEVCDQLVDCKEVSIDVLAEHSSYTLWVEELRELKSQMQQILPQFPTFRDGELFP
ncbi:hypothetical protein M0R45_005686 [Rubus argutus]|uniref:Uncharacterized protein n=1 Tax=Rubus argutus TaxID=59490 RepID=A0AAW1YNY0_RUBAR